MFISELLYFLLIPDVASTLCCCSRLRRLPGFYRCDQMLRPCPALLIRSTVTLDSFVPLSEIDGHRTSAQSFHVLIDAFRSTIGKKKPRLSESVSRVNPFLQRAGEGWGTKCSEQMYKADTMWQTQTHGCNYRKRRLGEGDLKGLNKDSPSLSCNSIIQHISNGFSLANRQPKFFFFSFYRISDRTMENLYLRFFLFFNRLYLSPWLLWTRRLLFVIDDEW